MPILQAAWRPQVLLWVVRILPAGATRVERLTEVKPFEAGSGPLDVPGGLVPVPTPGHTSGHCAFHLPERGVLIAGDALITAHPAGCTTGPQLCPRMFNHDEAAAVASLQALAGLSADVMLPGHGPVYRGSPVSAVKLALAAHRLIPLHGPLGRPRRAGPKRDSHRSGHNAKSCQPPADSGGMLVMLPG